jgi:alpha-D-ribose 1-methylphosphonate 5-triphosphate diphosphatase
MEFLDGAATWFRNARIVTADRVFIGCLKVDDGRIDEIGEHDSRGAGIDFQGDYLLPGLIELHTDHLESHYFPRRAVTWHAGSAVLAYDAQIAAAGITTVFDSFRVGVDEFDVGAQLGDEAALLAEAIRRAADADLLRADHLTHLRCEVAAPNVVDSLHAVLASHSAQLISLMDHSPGQRQYRDLEKYFIYYSGKSGRSRADLAEVAGERQRIGGIRALENRPRIVEIAKARGIVLASHDDTTAEEVALARCDGVTIAEFPTTLEAASASRAAGMATVMGAPNVVRGGSHSGNASAGALLTSRIAPARPPTAGASARRPGSRIEARLQSAAAPTSCGWRRTTASRSCARSGGRAAASRKRESQFARPRRVQCML